MLVAQNCILCRRIELRILFNRIASESLQRCALSIEMIRWLMSVNNDLLDSRRHTKRGKVIRMIRIDEITAWDCKISAIHRKVCLISMSYTPSHWVIVTLSLCELPTLSCAVKVKRNMLFGEQCAFPVHFIRRVAQCLESSSNVFCAPTEESLSVKQPSEWLSLKTIQSLRQPFALTINVWQRLSVRRAFRTGTFFPGVFVLRTS